MLKRTLSVVAGGVAVAGLWGVGPAAAADGAFPAVDRPAAYLVFPKIVVDQAAKLDTMIQISNADGALGLPCQSCPPIWVHCFYVKEISSACRGENFWFRMTPGQPVGWLASEGTDVWSAGDPVPPVQLVDGKFLGELKCYVSNEDGTPDYQNALVGAATTFQYDAVGQILDTRSYNGIGFRALNASAATDLTLVLSDGPGGEYDHCSLQLGLNHRFDVKPRADLSDNSSLTTSITLVPCSENLETGAKTTRGVQMLVFNEFEQRFSLSTSVGCRLDTKLVQVPFGSIFLASVQGTVSGQTRLRGVASSGQVGLIGIAEEERTDKTGSMGGAAYHLTMIGVPGEADTVVLPEGSAPD